MKDPFFERINDGEWNACVGVQGDELNYVEGFLEAAAIVADTLIDRELFGSRDTLAMPILYNVRHGLELALKFVIGTLARIGMAVDRPGEPDHNILAYWEHLHRQRVADHRSRELIEELLPFVKSLDRIDRDGGELRYFENRDGRRSLGKHPVIHLKLIRANVHKLRGLLRELTDRVECLEYEWPTGTFTKLLSRTDLTLIAKMLGPRPTWKEASFRERRDAVKAKFGIGNAPLTEAIGAIEKSRQLGVHLGSYARPKYLSAERALQLARMWLEAHPPQKPEGGIRILTRKDLRRLMEEGNPGQMRLDQAVMETFSFEEFADVEAVYYVGTVPLMGEEYEGKLERTLAEHRAAGENEQARWAKVHHIMSKTTFVAGLARGLRRAGSADTADQIEAMIEAAKPKDTESSAD